MFLLQKLKKFILQYITCRIPNKKVSPDLYRKVTTYQKHKHNSYCLRKTFNKKTGHYITLCRFDFPRRLSKEFQVKRVVASIAARRKLRRNNRLIVLP